MFHQTIVMGYLGQDPELRKTGSGTAVCNFSVATTEKWKSGDGEQQEHTEWYRCTAWGRTAEIAEEFLSKGSLVTVVGSMRTEKYEDKEGVEKYSVKLNVKELRLMPQPEKRSGGDRAERPAREERGSKPARDEKGSSRSSSQDDLDDDIPF